MKNFIELNLVDTGDKALVNIDKIINVVSHNEKGCFIIFHYDVKGYTHYFHVNEKYDEIIKKIEECEK